MATKAYVDVAERLLERLRRDKLRPGTRLPAERQLAEQLSVSRPTIREALAALELMGVVDTHVGSGTFVRSLDALDEDQRQGARAPAADASPSELLQARLLIEPAVVRLAATAWDRRALAAVARPLTKLERAAAAGSEKHPTEEDRQFHAAIAAAAGNAVLIELLQPLWLMMSQSLWRRLKARGWTADNTRRVALEHRQIYDAIRARDGDLAAFQMEKHIRGVITELFDS
jgi:DNA-binding FadR family transcriptional regulator